LADAQKRVIGIDPGNYATKYAYRDQDGRIVTGEIDNIAGPAFNLDAPPAGGEQADLLHVSLTEPEDGYEGEWFLGRFALNQLQDQALQNRDRRRAETHAVNLIAPAALAMICQDREQITLGVSATIRDYSVEAPLLGERLRGRHPVTFHLGPLAGVTRGPHVLSVEPFPQAVATAFDELMGDDLKPRPVNFDWRARPITVINLGHGQINYAVLAPKLQYVREAADSLDIGCWRVVEAIRDYLNGYPWYFPGTIPQLSQAMIDQYIMIDGERVDLKPVIEEVFSSLADRLFRAVNERAQVLFRQTETVILGGAAARAASEVFQTKFKRQVVVGQDPKMADARGILKRTEMMMGQEMAG
jgi:hypothetical protein